MKLGMKSCLSLASLLSCLVVLSCGTNEQGSDLAETTPTINVVDNRANIQIGAGYDSIREKARGHCLAEESNLNPSTLPGTERAKKILFDMSVVRSREELMRYMNVSATATLSYGISGGSAKINMINNQYIRKDSLVVVVQAKVENSSRSVGSIDLDAQFKKLYTEDPAGFHLRCGDGYVSGITTGGELYGIFEYQGLTKEERSLLESSISAGGTGFKANGKLTKEQQQSLSHSKLRVRYIQSGGTESTPINAAAFFSKAAGFAKAINSGGGGEVGNSWPLSVTLQDYYAAGLPAGDRSQITTLNNKRAIIRDLTKRFDHWQNRKLRIDDIQANPATYSSHDPALIQAESQLATTNLEAILSAATTCFSDVYACQEPGEFKKSNVTLPIEKTITTPRSQPSGPPLIVSMQLKILTQNDSKNKGRPFSIFLAEKGRKKKIVSMQNLATNEVFARQSTVVKPLNLSFEVIDPRHEFVLIINGGPSLKWKAKFQVIAKVKVDGTVREYHSPVSRQFYIEGYHAGGSPFGFAGSQAIFHFKLSPAP